MVSEALQAASLKDLVEWTGLSRDTLQSYRLGRRTPSAETLRTIAKALRKHGTAMIRHADALEAELERHS